ncbi:MAG: class I SAM-dependent methyltransferase [Phycisphaerales bacterium]|nr:class I SAM-dependent methyltransferase [Phycisphaerales bacterium]
MTFSTHDLRRFIDATVGRDARPLLLQTMGHFDGPGHAVDLGCGPGNDVLALLAAGWTVDAFDVHALAIETTAARAAERGLGDGLRTTIARFSEVELAPRSADLIHAGFSLPFTTADEFRTIWRAIADALRDGGRFVGQLFGVNDTWAKDPDRQELTAFTRRDVDALLAPFEVEHLEEVDRDGVTATGTEKHWHVFHIIAKRT